MSKVVKVDENLEKVAKETLEKININEGVCDYLERKYNSRSALFRIKVLEKCADIVLRCFKKNNKGGQDGH